MKFFDAPLFDHICETVHEAIRAWARVEGQEVIPSWYDAPEWMQQATRSSVNAVLREPHQSPETQHVQWMQAKLADGWVHGAEKDVSAKTHPLLVSFENLPDYEQKKDALLIAVVNALR